MFGLLFKLFGMGMIAKFGRDVAEGTYGENWKQAYEWLLRRKVLWSVVSACAMIFCLANGFMTALLNVAFVITTLLSLGLVDVSFRTPPPSWQTANWWKLLHHVGPDVTAGLGWAVLHLNMQCPPALYQILVKVHLDCTHLVYFITGLGMMLTWAIGGARLTEPPKIAETKLQVLQLEDTTEVK